MNAAPTVWDYSGIVAAAYEHYFGAEPYWDQAFYERRLRANGGRAFEIACGSGRLLRHYRAEEFRALLEGAGFAGITARHGYTDPQSSDPDDDLVFSAHRPPGR